MKNWLVSLCVVLVTGCALPSLAGRSMSTALPPDEVASTRLGTVVNAATRDHPGKTGVLPMSDAHEAFAARMRLAQEAQKTLDVQYYIWHRDTTGLLLLKALCDAADRGVRVRLLLDDNGIPDMDDTLAALSAHPNVEVRLFNPYSVRSFKPIGYLTHFSRANHRMHSKSFTADNEVTIVGGRNIADEYFAAAEDVQFADLDVLAIGPVVHDASDEFDRYWASASSYPIERLIMPPAATEIDDGLSELRTVDQRPDAQRYLEALQASKVVNDLYAMRLPLRWNRVTMISDDPAKGLGAADDDGLMLKQVIELVEQAQSHVELVSPYFVPTETGVAALTRLTARGVRVRVLTNALESTDVIAVHAGYAKRRVALLRGGVELWELRRDNDSPIERDSVRFGSSGASLHAKTFSVDGERMFVGSFNFDPRSARLNTELGFVIDDPTMATGLAAAFESLIPAHAYRVLLSDGGDLYWIEWKDGVQIRYDIEPGTTMLQRLGVKVLSAMPIEWLL